MADLKPCPFCGGTKLKVDRKSRLTGRNGLDMRVEMHTYSVRCNTCPIANQEKFAERCMPVIRGCSDCGYYEGCADCAMADDCDRKENTDD